LTHQTLRLSVRASYKHPAFGEGAYQRAPFKTARDLGAEHLRENPIEVILSKAGTIEHRAIIRAVAESRLTVQREESSHLLNPRLDLSRTCVSAPHQPSDEALSRSPR